VSSLSEQETTTANDRRRRPSHYLPFLKRVIDADKKIDDAELGPARVVTGSRNK
jgi:hypothetical protein